jgi:hypothetical protein
MCLQVATGGYPYGNSLTDANIGSVVATAISSTSYGGTQLPADEDGVYFVLTSADVTASSGLCSSYCGWHTYGTVNGKKHQIFVCW